MYTHVEHIERRSLLHALLLTPCVCVCGRLLRIRAFFIVIRLPNTRTRHKSINACAASFFILATIPPICLALEHDTHIFCVFVTAPATRDLIVLLSSSPRAISRVHRGRVAPPRPDFRRVVWSCVTSSSPFRCVHPLTYPHTCPIRERGRERVSEMPRVSVSNQ